ncbi:MAG: LamG domain-containing protein, partial [Candidatus Saccharimonadales bacterium]
ASSLGLTGDMTISCWIYVISLNNLASCLSKTLANIPAPFDYYVSTNGLIFFLRGNGSTYELVRATNHITTGAWHFIAVTMNGTSVTHYLDGSPNGTGTISTNIANGSGHAIIGNRSDGATKTNGYIDDVRLYNRALSPAEIQALYNLAD